MHVTYKAKKMQWKGMSLHNAVQTEFSKIEN